MVVLTYIYLSTVLIGFLSSLVSFRLDMPFHLKFFSVLLGLTFLVEVVAGVVVVMLFHHRNLWVYNVFTLVEFWAYGYYYYRLIRVKALKRIIYCFLVTFPIFWAMTVILRFGLTQWNGYVLTAGSFFSVLFALMYYYQLISAPEVVALRKLPEFWIATGMMIFYLGALPYFGALNFLLTNFPALSRSFLGVYKVLDSLMYSLLHLWLPMPDTKYNEVLIVLVVCALLLLILAAIVFLFLFLYQKRKFTQHQQVLEMERQFQEQSLSAQLEIQEQTFLAISQEIHDNVGQILSLAKVQINIMNESERMDLEMLQDVKENIGKAMADLRDLSKSLNSDRIRGVSIHETMRQEADRINKTGIIRAIVMVEGVEREIEPRKKLILFRIIQESIQNCIKHAKASKVSILFHYLEDRIRVHIQDDGKGFNPEVALRQGDGSGLGNMKTRAGLTGGTWSIESVVNEGTHIDRTMPYE